MNYDNNDEIQKNNSDYDNAGELNKEKPPYNDNINVNVPMEYTQERVVKKKRSSKFSYFLLILVGALLGSSITMAITYMYLPEILYHRGIYQGVGDTQPIIIKPAQDLTVYSAVARKAMPSVVGITTVSGQRDFFGRRAGGLGTGVIVDARGYILTNSHVVEDGHAAEIAVILYDGKRLPATVIWQERTLDLAVIKVEAANLPVAELGDSDQLEVGEIAVAIGNPLGLNFERTLTQGVISGLNRSLDTQNTIENLIQTDASINPGNSGGPLLNDKGQVIGINTAKISSGEGLGFSIPINTAKPIVEQIIEKGEFTRVYLGISGVNLDVYEASTGKTLDTDHGVFVVQIIENSPAEKYGISPGDVIIKIGNNDVKSMGSLQRELYRFRPGDQVTVTVLRSEAEDKSKEEEIKITFE